MTLRFNPPPNWPAPPEGWTPPADWKPDPAWGPVPQGWQLWVESDDSAPSPTGSAGAAAGKASWLGRHKVLTGLGAAAVLVVGIVAGTHGGGPADADAATPGDVVSTSPATPSAAPKASSPATKAPATVAPATKTPEKTKAAEDAPHLSAAQQNARRAAQSYLEFSAFSRQGLIDQLSSEYGDKFKAADAKVAVDSLDVDWNAQAVKSAASYLDTSGFSRQGLIDQLHSKNGDKYTLAQATHGVDAQKANWNAQAKRVAEDYLSMSGYSRQGLIDQLSSKYGDKFTVAQATAGVKAAGL